MLHDECEALIHEHSSLPFQDAEHAARFLAYRQLDPAVLVRWEAALSKLVRTFEKSALNVLDLGCGVGRFTIPLARLTCGKKLSVCALDKSSHMAAVLSERIRSSNLSNIEVEVADFMEWHAPVRFDIVFVSEVLQLVVDLSAFFRKIATCLERDGKLAIRGPSHRHLKKIEWLREFSGLLELDLQRTIDTEPLVDILAAHGFELCEIEEVDESVTIAKSVYLGMIRAKSYSILHLVDEMTFRKSLAALEASLVGRDFVRHSLTTVSSQSFGAGACPVKTARLGS